MLKRNSDLLFPHTAIVQYLFFSKNSNGW